jgi:DNA-directed RNA polymerase specialized sigma24 family protein
MTTVGESAKTANAIAIGQRRFTVNRPVAMRALSSGESACEAGSDELLIEGFERGDRRVAARIYDQLIGIVLGRLRVHLGRISPGNAEALVLRYVLGYGLAEVATLSGVSIAAAQSRLLRGRRELQRRVAADATRNAWTGQP